MASCTQYGTKNDSPSDFSSVKSAINTVAGTTGVGTRFILAVVIQESTGYVRAPTKKNGVRNPGLMQSHDGSGTCNDASKARNPRPDTEIQQMM